MISTFADRGPARGMARIIFTALACGAAWLGRGDKAAAADLDEMALDRWALLGEADRYQLKVAEKYYRDKNWKVAAAEYEKFLSLYEKSPCASYAQLKWSNCQSQLRKLNTAIKDGYQSVIDYWPDSPEAKAASYYIAKTYKDMGEIKLAKSAYAKTIEQYGGETVGVMARSDLADIAGGEKDEERRLALWRELAYNTPRNKETAPYCSEAAHQLAAHAFGLGDFAAGLKAMGAAGGRKADLQPQQICRLIRGPLTTLAATTEGKPRANKMADEAVDYFRNLMPDNPTSERDKDHVRTLTYLIAEVYDSIGRAEDALKAYDGLLERFGPDDATLGHKASVQKELRQFDAARQTYGRFQDQIDGTSQIAHTYRQQKKYDSAIPIYQELIVKDGAHASRWQWALAELYRDAGNFKEAIATFRQTDRFPEDMKEMALCHRKLGEQKEALGLYRQVVAAGDDWAPGALLEMARTYEEAHEREAAIKAFQQVCSRFPKSKEASVAHARLQDGYKINATLGGAVGE